MTWRVLGLILLLVVSALTPVGAQGPLIGLASVIDGDTIEIEAQW